MYESAMHLAKAKLSRCRWTEPTRSLYSWVSEFIYLDRRIRVSILPGGRDRRCQKSFTF